MSTGDNTDTSASHGDSPFACKNPGTQRAPALAQVTGAPSIEHLANKFLFPFNLIHEERMVGSRPHHTLPSLARPLEMRTSRDSQTLAADKLFNFGSQIRKRNLTAEEINTVRATEQALRRLKVLPRRSSAASQAASELNSDLGGPRQSVAFGSSLPRASVASVAGSQVRMSSVSVTGGPRQSVAASAAGASPGAAPRVSVFQPGQHRHTLSGAGLHSVAFAAAEGHPETPPGDDGGGNGGGGGAPLAAEESTPSAQWGLKGEGSKASSVGGGAVGRGRLRTETSMFSPARRGSVGASAAKRSSVVTWVGEGAPDGAGAEADAVREVTPETTGGNPFGDGTTEPGPARSRASGGAGTSGRGAEALRSALNRSGSAGRGFSAAAAAASASGGAGAAADAALLRQYSVFSQAAVRLSRRRSNASVARPAAADNPEPGEVRSTVESVRRALFGSGPRMCAPRPHFPTAPPRPACTACHHRFSAATARSALTAPRHPGLPLARAGR